MRFPIDLIRSRHLSRVAVIALVAGLAASCSDTSRFSQNPFANPFTSSDNRLAYAQPQPAAATPRYNNNTNYAINTVPAAGTVASQPLPPVGAVAQRSTPPAKYRLARGEQPLVTGTISTPASTPSPQIGGFKAGGWTATGGTSVTAAAGENINTLSNRYGVPSDAIMKVNGLTSRSLNPGQQVIIPVYNAALNSTPAATTVAAATDQPYPGDVAETTRGSVGEVKVRPVATTPAAGTKPKPVAAASGVHVVKPGETLTSIAKAYGTTRPRLAKENGIDEWTTVKIGQKLVVRGTAHAAAPAPAAEVVDNRPPRDVPMASRPVAAPKPVQTAHAANPAPVKPARPQAKSIAAEAMQMVAPHNQQVKTAAVKPVAVKPVAVKPVQTAKVAPVGAAAKAKPAQVAAVKPADAAKAAKLKAEKLAAAKQKLPASKPAQVAAAKPIKPVEVSQPAPVATGTISPTASAPQPAAELPKDATASNSGNPAFRWPVKGRIIQGFGRNSDGINISVPEGTEVKAAEDGVVAYAGNELKGYGNLVLIRHANGYVTAYGHAKELDVKKGEAVKRGQTIGTAGQTGNVTSPQLLFEVRKGAAPVDPTRYLSGT